MYFIMLSKTTKKKKSMLSLLFGFWPYMYVCIYVYIYDVYHIYKHIMHMFTNICKQMYSRYYITCRKENKKG